LDCVKLKVASTFAWPPQISIIDPIFASNQICLETLGHDKKMKMCQIKGKRKLGCSNLGFQHEQVARREEKEVGIVNANITLLCIHEHIIGKAVSSTPFVSSCSALVPRS
jgi:hypothetical protein